MNFKNATDDNITKSVHYIPWSSDDVRVSPFHIRPAVSLSLTCLCRGVSQGRLPSTASAELVTVHDSVLGLHELFLHNYLNPIIMGGQTQGPMVPFLALFHRVFSKLLMAGGRWFQLFLFICQPTGSTGCSFLVFPLSCSSICLNLTFCIQFCRYHPIASEQVSKWASLPGSQLLSDVQTFFLSCLLLLPPVCQSICITMQVFCLNPISCDCSAWLLWRCIGRRFG